MQTARTPPTAMDVPSSDPVPRLLLKVDEAATALGCSRAKLYQLLAAGEIASVVIGRSRRIPLEALRQWVADQSAN